MMNRCSTAVVAVLLIFGACKENSSEPPSGNTPVRDVNMVAITGGTFQMGSPPGYSEEQPIHAVTVGSFNMDKYQVTFEKWTSVRDWGMTHGYTDLPVGRNGYIGTTNHPVTFVTWYDIVKWCNARSEMDGLPPVYYTDSTQTTVYRTGNFDLANGAVKRTANGYRLPTESEWEYAARGGALTHGHEYSGSNNIDSVAWYSTNSGNNTHPVGGLTANELGLFDMSGNVWERCWDWYGAPYPSTAQTNPLGPTTGIYRVLRGGTFTYAASACRASGRNFDTPASKFAYYGFRCAQN